MRTGLLSAAARCAVPVTLFMSRVAQGGAQFGYLGGGLIQGIGTRALDRSFPPISSLLDAFRDKHWCEAARRRGLSHPGRYFARIHSMDKAMDATCGLPWRFCARDKEMWRVKGLQWVSERDVPWASGVQLSIGADEMV